MRRSALSGSGRQRLYAAEEGFDLVWTRPARKRDAEADVATEAEGQPEPEA